MCTPQGIIEKLGCLAFDEAVKAAIEAGKYVHHYTINREKLKREMESLKDRSEIIEGKVRDAKGRGEVVYDAVLHWRTDVDTMTQGVQELVGPSSGTGNLSCFACSCPNIKQRYRKSKQAAEKIPDVQELTQRSHFDEISHPKPPPTELEFPSKVNYVDLASRTPVFEQIVNALNDPSVNVIGVHGLGGVGKTTLVKEVGKKMRHNGTFNQVALAVVSTDLNVMKIQSQLADSLNFTWDPRSADQPKGRANQLWNKFKNGERYLVILDDIWNEVDIESIGIPIMDGKTGCKVLLTSRNKDLLVNRMNVDKAFPIAELPEPDAWTLFKKLTGNSIDESLASKVCDKCKGLPVAINALGAALKGKPEHAWKDALDKLDKYMITNIEGIDSSIWASLKLSYDMLSSDAKSCFLLCCLCPDDAEISIDDLARQCLTRCLLSPNPSTLEEARRAVRTLVDSLKFASLLSSGNEENFVRIHDVIRDVGISIARKEEGFFVDHGAVRWPRNPINGPHYSAISLRTEKIKRLPDELTCPQLHTLMFLNSEFSDLEVPDNFFSGMKQLTVLILSRMRFRRLPSSLAELKGLGMLCLEDCELEDISILGNLKTSLEVLSLRDSTIEALPQEIGKLTNLLSLDLRGCRNLKVIPQGVISNLTSLEELYLPEYFYQRETLEELRESLSTGQLTTLHMDVRDVELLPKESLNFEKLRTFKISVGGVYYSSMFGYIASEEKLYSRLTGTRFLTYKGSSLRNEFIPLAEKAESLLLINIEGLKKLLQDRGVGNRFLDLKYMEVISCDDYMEYLIGEPKSFDQSHRLHPSKSFNNLIEVSIEGCKMKYLFSPSSARGLVHLKKLSVVSCEIMEEIIGYEGQNDEDELSSAVNFSKLNQLELRYLPNLICFYAKKEKTRTTMGSSPARAQPLFNEKVIFPVLENLIIRGLDNIVKIWDKQSIAIFEEQGSFCQLINVKVYFCNKLMHVFTSNMRPLLKNLQDLDVSRCENMKAIAEFEGDEDGLRNEVAFPALENLEMVRAPKITEIRDKQPIPESKKEVESLCKLRRIEIAYCDQLMYVFPSNMLPQNLEALEIGRCNELEVIFSKDLKEKEVINNDIIVFPWLKNVKLWALPKLQSFYTETQVLFSHRVISPVLESLTISKVGNIVEIWEKQSIAAFKDKGSFCQLTNVTVKDCNKLLIVFPRKILPLLKNLKELEVNGCDAMEGIVDFEGEIDEDGLENEICFSKLFRLDLKSLPNMVSFCTKLGTPATTDGNATIHAQPLFNEKVTFPVLEKLNFRNLNNIVEIWDKQSIVIFEEKGSFCQLMNVEVKYCNKLMHVFPSNMRPLLKNLQDLEVHWCENMKAIAEFEGDEDGLRNEVAFPALENLEMVRAPKITEIRDKQPIPESKKEVESLCKLRRIEIAYCDQLMYVFPSNMLPQNLEALEIGRCNELEVIFSKDLKEKEVINNDIIVFPWLKNVTLWALPKLQSFYTETQVLFSHRVISPVLERLTLSNVGNIVEIWDKQSIAAFKDKGSFCQLTNVTVKDCNKLLIVFPRKILPLLKNLEELEVNGCDAMEGIVDFEGETDEDGLRNEICFSKLCRLDLISLPNMVSFYTKLGTSATTDDGNATIHAQPLFNEKVISPVLERLTISEVGNIVEIWDKQSIAAFKDKGSFCQLTNVTVKDCNKLLIVFPRKILPLLKNLEELEVNGCDAMEGIVDFEGETDEDGLRNEICFSKLCRLDLISLPNMVSFYTKLGTSATTDDGNATIHAQPLFNEKVISPVLERLTISKVGNIVEIWDKQSIAAFKDKGSFCQLTNVTVKDCNKLLIVFPRKILPLLKNLKELEVDGCDAMEGIVDFEGEIDEDGHGNEICFSKLFRLDLKSLPNMVSFGTKLGTPATTDDGNATIHAQPLFNEKVISPVLERLTISKVGNIVEIWDKQSIAAFKDKGSFCQLTNVTVKYCNKLLIVFPRKILPLLKNLEELEVNGCDAMEGIVDFEGEIDEDGLGNEICFNKLFRLDLKSLPNMVSFCTKLGTPATTDGNATIHAQSLFNEKVAFPALTDLILKELDKITWIWDNQPLSKSEKEAKSFCKLTSISIFNCVHLEYVLPFYMLPQLKNLQELDIRGCTKMEAIISNNPKEKEATNSDTILLPQLQTVNLRNLPNLKSLCTKTQLFFSNKDAFPMLEEIKLPESLEFLRDRASTKEECGTSGKSELE